MKNLKYAIGCLPLILVLLFTSCSKTSDSEDSSCAEGIDACKEIDEKGDILYSSDSSFVLEIPEGAVSGGVTLGIEALKKEDYPEKLAKIEDPLTVFKLTPEGQTFDKPLKIKFKSNIKPKLENGNFSLPIPPLAHISGDTVEPIQNAKWVLSSDSMYVLEAEISHFSWLAFSFDLGDGNNVVISPQLMEVLREAWINLLIQSGLTLERVTINSSGITGALIGEKVSIDTIQKDSASDTTQIFTNVVCKEEGTGTVPFDLIISNNTLIRKLKDAGYTSLNDSSSIEISYDQTVTCKAIPKQTCDTSTTVCTTVGKSGGVVYSLDSTLKLEIPADALSGDTTVSIQKLDSAQIKDQLKEGESSNVFELLPHGITFSKPVTFTFTKKGIDSVDEKPALRLAQLFTLSGEIVEYIDSATIHLDTESNNTVYKGKLHHFSHFVHLTNPSLISTKKTTAFVGDTVKAKFSFVIEDSTKKQSYSLTSRNTGVFNGNRYPHISIDHDEIILADEVFPKYNPEARFSNIGGLDNSNNLNGVTETVCLEEGQGFVHHAITTFYENSLAVKYNLGPKEQLTSFTMFFQQQIECLRKSDAPAIDCGDSASVCKLFDQGGNGGEITSVDGRLKIMVPESFVKDKSGKIEIKDIPLLDAPGNLKNLTDTRIYQIETDLNDLDISIQDWFFPNNLPNTDFSVTLPLGQPFLVVNNSVKDIQDPVFLTDTDGKPVLKGKLKQGGYLLVKQIDGVTIKKEPKKTLKVGQVFRTGFSIEVKDSALFKGSIETENYSINSFEEYPQVPFKERTVLRDSAKLPEYTKTAYISRPELPTRSDTLEAKVQTPCIGVGDGSIEVKLLMYDQSFASELHKQQIIRLDSIVNEIPIRFPLLAQCVKDTADCNDSKTGCADIGPDGGEVVSKDGMFKVTVPKGAFSDPTQVAVIIVDSPDRPDLGPQINANFVYDIISDTEPVNPFEFQGEFFQDTNRAGVVPFHVNHIEEGEIRSPENQEQFFHQDSNIMRITGEVPGSGLLTFELNDDFEVMVNDPDTGFIGEVVTFGYTISSNPKANFFGNIKEIENPGGNPKSPIVLNGFENVLDNVFPFPSVKKVLDYTIKDDLSVEGIFNGTTETNCVGPGTGFLIHKMQVTSQPSNRGPDNSGLTKIDTSNSYTLEFQSEATCKQETDFCSDTSTVCVDIDLNNETVIESKDGLFIVKIPAGAVDESLKVGVTPTEVNVPGTDTNRVGPVGYDISPSGLDFNKPIEVIWVNPNKTKPDTAHKFENPGAIVQVKGRRSSLPGNSKITIDTSRNTTRLSGDFQSTGSFVQIEFFGLQIEQNKLLTFDVGNEVLSSYSIVTVQDSSFIGTIKSIESSDPKKPNISIGGDAILKQDGTLPSHLKKIDFRGGRDKFQTAVVKTTCLSPGVANIENTMLIEAANIGSIMSGLGFANADTNAHKINVNLFLPIQCKDTTTVPLLKEQPVGVHPAPASLGGGLEGLFSLGPAFANRNHGFAVSGASAAGIITSFESPTLRNVRGDFGGPNFGMVGITLPNPGPSTNAAIFQFGQSTSDFSEYSSGSFGISTAGSGTLDGVPIGGLPVSDGILVVTPTRLTRFVRGTNQFDPEAKFTSGGTNRIEDRDIDLIEKPPLISAFQQEANKGVLIVADSGGSAQASGKPYLYLSWFQPITLPPLNKRAAKPDTVIAIGPLGSDSRRIRCVPGGSICIVSNFGSNDVSIINWDGDSTVTIVGNETVGTGPVGIDIMEDSTGLVKAVVPGYGDNSLSILDIDKSNGTVTKNNKLSAPSECLNPGHAVFTNAMKDPGTKNQIVVSCNGGTTGAFWILDIP